MMATIFLLDLLDKKATGQQINITFNGHHQEGMDTTEKSWFKKDLISNMIWFNIGKMGLLKSRLSCIDNFFSFEWKFEEIK